MCRFATESTSHIFPVVPCDQTPYKLEKWATVITPSELAKHTRWLFFRYELKPICVYWVPFNPSPLRLRHFSLLISCHCVMYHGYKWYSHRYACLRMIRWCDTGRWNGQLASTLVNPGRLQNGNWKFVSVSGIDVIWNVSLREYVFSGTVALIFVPTWL